MCIGASKFKNTETEGEKTEQNSSRSHKGIRFRTVPEILQAVDRSIRTINRTGADKGILRLPHRWQRVVHNAGDYSEGQ